MAGSNVKLAVESSRPFKVLFSMSQLKSYSLFYDKVG